MTQSDEGPTTPDERLAVALREVNRLKADVRAEDGRSLVRATIRGREAAVTALAEQLPAERVPSLHDDRHRLVARRGEAAVVARRDECPNSPLVERVDLGHR